jgi:hypothetical protein
VSEFFIAQVHSLLTAVTVGANLLDYTALVWVFEILAVGLRWCGSRMFSNDYKKKEKRNVS